MDHPIIRSVSCLSSNLVRLPLSESVGQQTDHLISYPGYQSGSQLVTKLVD